MINSFLGYQGCWLSRGFLPCIQSFHKVMVHSQVYKNHYAMKLRIQVYIKASGRSSCFVSFIYKQLRWLFFLSFRKKKKILISIKSYFLIEIKQNVWCCYLNWKQWFQCSEVLESVTTSQHIEVTFIDVASSLQTLDQSKSKLDQVDET